ncbi:MAG: hypothetical protein ACR2FM_04825 [Candidatus Saccharimonadales bacterium]
MAAAAETLEREHQPIPVDERLLTEIDHLAAHRLENGSYPDDVLADVLVNLKTAVQEGGIPHAVSTTEHEYLPAAERGGVFMWMGKTAVQNAMSGYRFHIDPEAIKRVDVEIDEARHAQEDLGPGILKILISPKMSEKDASPEVAQKEHLADDDAIRMSWLTTDENGVIQKRTLQSLLVKDVPLDAWVAMLQDPDNIFGKSIAVKDPDSALSVMQVHRELEIPISAVNANVVDIVGAVVPYIADQQMKASVVEQIKKFNSDQVELDKRAEYIAQQWLRFEVELDKSFAQGSATYEIERFIVGLQTKWKISDAEIINNHLVGNSYLMTRQLAAIVEKAKQNTLWTSAAVMTGNEAVLKQMDTKVAQRINHNAERMYVAQQTGVDTRAYEAENNRLIASQNINVGGGCGGTNSDAFGKDAANSQNDTSKETSDTSTTLVWKPGICRIEACPTRPGMTEVAQCSVCRGCQAKFDIGQDPSKGVAQSKSTDADNEELMKDIYAFLAKSSKKKNSSLPNGLTQRPA